MKMNFVSPVVNSFASLLEVFFANQSKPTSEKLSLLALAMLMNGSTSVRECHRHFISSISEKSLNSFYHMLSDKKDTIDLDFFSDSMLKLAMSAIQGEAQDLPIILCIDDTMVEKAGKHFDELRVMHDHSGYRQKKSASNSEKGNFIKGHSFVSLLGCIPTKYGYESVLIGQRLYTGISKLQIASEMVLKALKSIGQSQVLLLCDSWYPKAEVADLQQIDNVEILCSVRSDTAMWALPQMSSGRGRPRKFGERLNIDDFELTPIPQTNLSMGTKMVKTRLFKDKEVCALVTKIGEKGARRLFMCTNPDACSVFVLKPDYIPSKDALKLIELNPLFAIYDIYSMRWSIETTYQQLKCFWNFNDYKVRRQRSISRLINIQAIVYSILALLPILNEDLAHLKDASIQDRRIALAKMLARELFFRDFKADTQTEKNSRLLRKIYCFLQSGSLRIA